MSTMIKRRTTLLSLALLWGTSSVVTVACGSDGEGDGDGPGGFGGAAGSPARPGSGGKAEGGEPPESSGGGGGTLYCGDGQVGGAEECEPPGQGRCGIDCILRDPVCGNKVREEDEECDPPNGETCSKDCDVIVIECGNSVVQAQEECDPPDDKSCNDNCYRIECGDFEVEGKEECDPPNGLSCDDKCRAIEPECGDKAIQPGEQCDPPNGRNCSDECRLTGVVNLCPEVIIFAAPNESTIGSDVPISIDADIVDPDGDEVFISWRVTSGTISDPDAAEVNYFCTEPGPQTVEITVRDSDPACAVSWNIVPFCHPAEE
jgi:ubiquitin